MKFSHSREGHYRVPSLFSKRPNQALRPGPPSKALAELIQNVCTKDNLQRDKPCCFGVRLRGGIQSHTPPFAPSPSRAAAGGCHVPCWASLLSFGAGAGLLLEGGGGRDGGSSLAIRSTQRGGNPLLCQTVPDISFIGIKYAV